MGKMILNFILLLIAAFQATARQNIQIKRNDFYISSTNGVKIQIREINNNQNNPKSIPLLMVHGGGPDAVTSFDLQSNTPSFAEELVNRGFHVYLINIRGWGASTLPDYNLKDTTQIIGNVYEASDDINAAINWITQKESIHKVNLFGWATGGHWIAYASANTPEKIAKIICLNTLYGVNGNWSLHDAYADRKDSRLFKKLSLFRETKKENLSNSWTKTIPIPDKESWRDPVVEQSYRNQSLSFSTDKTIFKVPGGYQEESFYMAQGKKYWDAKDIKVPALVIRSKYDFWSREIDIETFRKDFPNHIRSEFKIINGTHYVFLDRSENGRDDLINLMVDFVNEK